VRLVCTPDIAARWPALIRKLCLILH